MTFTTTNLHAFLNDLRVGNLDYELRQRRDDAIMVEIAVPGERWEVEFLEDGTVDVEIFRSDGEIHDSAMLQQLMERHSENE